MSRSSATGNRMAPAPFVAALAERDACGVHAEFAADGELDTGSIDFGRSVTLRSAQGALRLVVPRLPDTLAAALLGRHVSAVVGHRWLADPRIMIEDIGEEDGRLTIALSSCPSPVSSE